jgi:hypothetical protein
VDGRSPGREHCLKLAAAAQAGIRPQEATAAIGGVDDAVHRWPEFADMAGCTRARALQIAETHRRLGGRVPSR